MRSRIPALLLSLFAPLARAAGPVELRASVEIPLAPPAASLAASPSAATPLAAAFAAGPSASVSVPPQAPASSALGAMGAGISAVPDKNAAAAAAFNAAYDNRAERGGSAVPVDAPAPVVHVDGLKFRDVNHVVLFSRGDPKNLYRILSNPSFPRGVEVVSGDMSLIGWTGKLVRLYDVELDALKKRSASARKNGDEKGALKALDEYRRKSLQLRNILKGFALRHRETGGIPQKILDISREKSLKLWVGGPRYDQASGKLYNSYSLVENGKIVAVHNKSALYTVEKAGVLEAPEKFDGDFLDKLILICWEAEALNPHYQKPSPFAEEKKAISARSLKKPFLVYVPAYWPVKDGVGLKGQVSKAVRRGDGRDSIDKASALRPEGALALVNNDGAQAYVAGPSRDRSHPSRKAEVYGSLDRPGILWVRSNSDGDLIISKYDDALAPILDSR